MRGISALFNRFEGKRIKQMFDRLKENSLYLSERKKQLMNLVENSFKYCVKQHLNAAMIKISLFTSVGKQKIEETVPPRKTATRSMNQRSITQPVSQPISSQFSNKIEKLKAETSQLA